MAEKKSQCVLRAYSLSVEMFDHLQTVKRQRQRDIDRRTDTVAKERDFNWVSTSEALSEIVYVHRLLTSAAEREGTSVDQIVTALCLGTLTSIRNKGEQLPADAASHLEAYRVACGHEHAIDALTEIVRTHEVLAEIGAREGSSLSVIAKNATVANEWHKQGVRGVPVMPKPAVSWYIEERVCVNRSPSGL